MSLLRQVMDHPLDPGYEAARRATGGVRPQRGVVTRIWVGLLAVLLGAVTVVAARELRRPEPSALAARTLLESQISERQGDVDTLSRRVSQVGAEVETLRSDALSDASPSLLDTLNRDGVLSGSTALQGPGVVVTLRDAPVLKDADVDPDSRVQDLDLQIVVNSLWSVGAEAVAINDQRLTPVTAVRSAGDAILVNLQPVSSPYSVVAIGDPGKLQSGLARSPAGDWMVSLTNFGIQSSTVGQSELDVPGDDSVRLRYARPVESPATDGSGDATPAAGGPTSDEDQGYGQ
ncbi:uncharacterized protein YlxW (UPF0749 family) [Cellulomonas sp. PhB143]|nr:uncharacterized protein YlxW (UPF0749 family) [Cellulomonas sp. PhB143]